MMIKVPLEKFKFVQRVKQRRKKLKQLHTFELNSVVFTF